MSAIAHSSSDEPSVKKMQKPEEKEIDGEETRPSADFILGETNPRLENLEKMTPNDKLNMHKLFGEFDALNFGFHGLDKEEPAVSTPKWSHDIMHEDFLSKRDNKLKMHDSLGEIDASVLKYYGLKEELPSPMPEPSCHIVEGDFLPKHMDSVLVAVSVPKIDEGEIQVEAQLLKVEVTSLDVTIAKLKKIISKEIQLPIRMIHLSGRTGWLYDKRSLADYKLGDYRFGDYLPILLSTYNNHEWAYSMYDPNPDPAPDIKHSTQKNYFY